MPDITPYFPEGPCNITIIGEAPGQKEAEQGRPFVGPSGKVLTDMLHEAQILRSDCHVTNVFLNRPPNNELKHWCYGSKKEADAAWKEEYGEGKYPLKSVSSGKYMRIEHLGEIGRLQKEIEYADPNLIIALGNTPLWALTGDGGITKNRGTIMEVEILGKTYKLLPTFHPAYVLRLWESRPIVIADLMKAKLESEFPQVRRTPRELWIEPTIADIIQFTELYLKPVPIFAWDIETSPKGGFITCIGFGTATHAICIPFADTRTEHNSYWSTPEQEAKAIHLVRNILHLPNAKVAQNGMYDMQWVWNQWGITPRGELHDTQLLHHSMYPEMKKDLGFLGSLYTNEVAWKGFRSTAQEGKKDA